MILQEMKQVRVQGTTNVILKLEYILHIHF